LAKDCTPNPSTPINIESTYDAVMIYY